MSAPAIQSIFTMVDKYGLGIGLAIGVFILLYMTLKYIMKNSNIILESYRQDQKLWNLTINNHLSQVTKALDKVADRFEHHETATQADRTLLSNGHDQIIKVQNSMLEVLIKRGGNDGT